MRFRARQNCPRERSDWRRLIGKAFHRRGPATPNARSRTRKNKRIPIQPQKWNCPTFFNMPQFLLGSSFPIPTPFHYHFYVYMYIRIYTCMCIVFPVFVLLLLIIIILLLFCFSTRTTTFLPDHHQNVPDLKSPISSIPWLSRSVGNWVNTETNWWTAMLFVHPKKLTFILRAVRLSAGPATEIEGSSDGKDGKGWCWCCWRSTSLASHCASRSRTSYS